ncbi:MAG TPA: inner membrane CreD family protein, partial [Chitinophagaceae bacterium]
METATESLWSKSKVLIKGIIIIVLVLFLLIPTFFVTELVTERQQRQKEAIQEVSSKWATEQVVTGPIIVLPYWKVESTQVDKIIRSKQFAYFLPDELTINGNITPKEKYRGIYKVMLYTSKLDISGIFKNIDPARLGIAASDIIWGEAYVKLNISDVKGLNKELHIKINDSSYTLSP